MKVIEPTPSQAAVVLKNYFRSLGYNVTLAETREGLSRSRGYANWNTMASQVDVRGDKANTKAKEQATPQTPVASYIGPFEVYSNGDLFDTVAYDYQAWERAELLQEIQRQDLLDPVDVVIKELNGKFVEKIIEAFTRVRVRTTSEWAVEYPQNVEKLNEELACCMDQCLPIRVEEYETLYGNGDLLSVKENPVILYEYTPPTDSKPVWTVDREDGETGHANQPFPQFGSLKEVEEWFSKVLRERGIVAKPNLVPTKRLTQWTLSATGYPETLLLNRN